MKQSHLHRLREVNASIKAHNEPNPPPLAKKVFTAKYLIPVLDNYNFDIYPPIYWDGWTRVPPSFGPVDSKTIARPLHCSSLSEEIWSPMLSILLTIAVLRKICQ